MSNEPSEPVGFVRKPASGLIALLIVAASTPVHAQSQPTIRPADQRATVEVGRYRLQSNPWVNLHQRLLHEARFQTPPPTALSGEDLSKWKKAVEIYRTFLGRRSPIFDEELIGMNAALSTSTAKSHAKWRFGRS